MRLRLGAALLAALLASAACTAADPSNDPVPKAAAGPRCIEPPAASSAPAASAAPAKSGGPALPAMALKCFVGGRWTSMADLRGPAIVNLWASWCAPCRTELPAFQRFADRTKGKVRVVGVVTKDSPDRAQAIIDETHLTFPMLEDREQHLMLAVGKAIGRPVALLPVTLFIGPDGRLAHVYNSVALDEPKIEALAAEHLGVTA